MRPTERACGSIRLAEHQSTAGDVGSIPELLGQSHARAREGLEGAHQLGGRQTHGKEMTGALTCQHRPCPAASIPIPRQAVLVLTVLVAYVSPPARPRRQADLQ